MKVRYEEMLPHEIVESRTKFPVAYLPLGGLEWHGEHLAVGNDAIKVHALAIEVAKKGGGLVFPPLFYGENREGNLMEFDHDEEGEITKKMSLPEDSFKPGYMHNSSHRQNAFYVDLLIHVLREIESLGFKVIIALAGHYPLLYHLREAIKEYSKTGKAKVWALSGYDIVKDVIPHAGDHAAKWETSLLMALRPDCVDMSRLPEDKKIPLVGIKGVDPRGTASLEFGKFAVDILTNRIVDQAIKLLGEK